MLNRINPGYHTTAQTTIKALYNDEVITFTNGERITIPHGYELPLINGTPILNANGVPVINQIATNSLVGNYGQNTGYNNGVLTRHNNEICLSEMNEMCNTLNAQGHFTDDEYAFFMDNLQLITGKYADWTHVYPKAAMNHRMQARLQVFDEVLRQYREQRNSNGLNSKIMLNDYNIAVYDEAGNLLGNTMPKIFTEAGCSKNNYHGGVLSNPNLQQSGWKNKHSLLSTPEQSYTGGNVYGYGTNCQTMAYPEVTLIDDSIKYNDKIPIITNPFKSKEVRKTIVIETPTYNENILNTQDLLLKFSDDDRLVGRIGQMLSLSKDINGETYNPNVEWKEVPLFEECIKFNDDKLLGRIGNMGDLGEKLKKAITNKEMDTTELSWAEMEVEQKYIINHPRFNLEKMRNYEDISVYNMIVKHDSTLSQIEGFLKLEPAFYDKLGNVNTDSGYIVTADNEFIKRLPIPTKVLMDFADGVSITNADFKMIWEDYVVKRGNELLTHFTHTGNKYPVASSVDDFANFPKEHRAWLIKHNAMGRNDNLQNNIRNMTSYIVEAADINDIIMADSIAPSINGSNILDSIKSLESSDRDDFLYARVRKICEYDVFIRESYSYINTNILFEGMKQYGQFIVNELPMRLYDEIAEAVLLLYPVIIVFPRKPGCKRYNVTISLEGSTVFTPLS